MTKKITSTIVGSIKDDFGFPPAHETQSYISTFACKLNRLKSLFIDEIGR